MRNLFQSLSPQYGGKPSSYIRVNWGNIPMAWSEHYDNPPVTDMISTLVSMSPIESQTDNLGSSQITMTKVTVLDYDERIVALAGNGHAEGSYTEILFTSDPTVYGYEMLVSGRLRNVSFNERDKTVSFDIISNVRSTNIGYIQKNIGYFENQEVCYPKVFGFPGWYEGAKVYNRPTGVLKNDLSLAKMSDYESVLKVYTAFYKWNATTLKVDWQALSDLAATIGVDVNHLPQFDTNTVTIENGRFFPVGVLKLNINNCIFKGSFASGSDVFTITESNAPYYEDIAVEIIHNAEATAAIAAGDYPEDPSFKIKLTDPSLCLKGQTLYFSTTSSLFGVVNHAFKVIAQDGLILTIDYQQMNQADTYFRHPGDGLTSTATSRYITTDGFEDGLAQTLKDRLNKMNITAGAINPADFEDNNLLHLESILKVIKTTRDFFWKAPEGSQVTLHGKYTGGVLDRAVGSKFVLDHDVNALLGTEEVHQVGMRFVGTNKKPNNKREIVPLPSWAYTVTTNEAFSGGIVTYVTLKVEDSILEIMGYEPSQVYAITESKISSSIVSQLDYITTNYVDKTLNSASVTAGLANYPANWVLREAKDATELMREICYQARLGIRLDSNTIYVISLFDKKTPTLSVTNYSFKQEGLEATFDETFDLITKYKATFRDYPAQDISRNYINSNNETKYGVQERSYDFFIFDNYGCVRDAVDFYLNLNSCCWKTVRGEFFLEIGKHEVFDPINLQQTFGDLTGDFIIRNIALKLNENSASMEAWGDTPIDDNAVSPWLFGATSAYESFMTNYVTPLPKDISWDLLDSIEDVTKYVNERTRNFGFACIVKATNRTKKRRGKKIKSILTVDVYDGNGTKVESDLPMTFGTSSFDALEGDMLEVVLCNGEYVPTRKLETEYTGIITGTITKSDWVYLTVKVYGEENDRNSRATTTDPLHPSAKMTPDDNVYSLLVKKDTQNYDVILNAHLLHSRKMATLTLARYSNKDELTKAIAYQYHDCMCKAKWDSRFGWVVTDIYAPPEVYCRVKSSTPKTDPNKWDYKVEQVFGATATEEFDAINLNESENPADGVIPSTGGINISGADFPAGFSVKPIPVGAYVSVRFTPNGNYFLAQNIVDGTCEA